jgi:ATP-dependent RNA helicase DDX21
MCLVALLRLRFRCFHLATMSVYYDISDTQEFMRTCLSLGKISQPQFTVELCHRELDLSQVRFFVLDEADEMLNMGFQEDVESVLETVPEAKQTMMFSATMPQWVRKLARKYAQNHIMVDLVGEHDTGTPHRSCS